MAPEPSHLVNITKTCLRCESTDVKFLYYNNKKLSQPRYLCKRCGRLFTYGGTIRVPRVVRPRPPQTRTTSTAVVAADRRTGPAQRGRGRPRRSQPVAPTTGPREIQETPATCARTEARTVATRARTEALTVARPTTGALGLPCIPVPGYREIESPVQRPVRSPVVSSLESPAVRGPVPTARIAELVPGDVDVDQRPASRSAAAVIVQGGDVKENWIKAVLGVSPYGLAPASNGKRMKVMRIKCDGKESVVRFWVEDSDDEGDRDDEDSDDE